VYVPGCPPGPETLMHGILTLHEQIRSGELLARRGEGRGAGILLSKSEPTPRRVRSRLECVAPVPARDRGELIAEGKPAAVRANAEVQQVYLGSRSIH